MTQGKVQQTSNSLLSNYKSRKIDNLREKMCINIKHFTWKIVT